MTRKFSSTSVETTLASGINSSVTSMTVASGTVALDPDTTSEEIVFITAVSSDTFTIVRGRAGTSQISHSAGATVKHVLTSDDLNAFEAGLDSGAGGTVSSLLLMGG
jgi:hypothetical protein